MAQATILPTVLALVLTEPFMITAAETMLTIITAAVITVTPVPIIVTTTMAAAGPIITITTVREDVALILMSVVVPV